ncbi:hypothetical protein AKJ51_00685 [candidate division MSBL1 archaeon SCGC-AAA382A20]|uniref:TOTE conflict system primase domain-containing protein n=1 Tax=candidate division MSBL1 archaeon SCGC-AAA382A20 TaxID=1698280 RepID=A0A133VMC9_9EURY|nr:hypothetical protein AKJ51_00685 [candidate division MSBL1 archaeon SCGC-AAA382A20]
MGDKMPNIVTTNMMIKEKAKLLLELFANRRDIYAVQWCDGEKHGYRAVRDRLTVERVEKHIRGEITLAFYALGKNSKAKWMAIDADTTKIGEFEEIIGRYKELNLPRPIMEFSGRRGYHYIFLLDKPVAGWKAKALGEAITKKHEVFPKGSESSSDTSSPGSCLKIPLGVHQVSQECSVLVNRHFEKIDNPWERLRNVKKIDISDYQSLLGRKKRNSKGTATDFEIGVLRPCTEKALKGGAKLGARNTMGHIICCELRRLGLSKKEAGVALSCWDLRNEKRLGKKELYKILESAYSGDQYKYSCSRLKKTLECVGRENCRFIQEVRRKKKEREKS